MSDWLVYVHSNLIWFQRKTSIDLYGIWLNPARTLDEVERREGEDHVHSICQPCRAKVVNYLQFFLRLFIKWTSFGHRWYYSGISNLMDGKSPWMASSFIFTTRSALIQVSLQSWNRFELHWVAMSQNWVDRQVPQKFWAIYGYFIGAMVRASQKHGEAPQISCVFMLQCEAPVR